MSGSERRFGKSSRAGFGVEEFVRGFYIRVIKILDSIKNCLG